MPAASINIAESVEVPASAEKVWALLTNPWSVVECVPGATVTGERDDGTLDGNLAVKLGPTRVQFAGEVMPIFDNESREGTLTARGADRGGRTKAQAQTKFRLEPTASGGTTIVITGSIELSGALASFLQTGGVHLTKRMLKDFGDGIADKLASPEPSPDIVTDVGSVLTESAGPAGQRDAVKRRPNKPVNGFRLLALVAKDWFASLFRRRSRQSVDDQPVEK
jgi:carbon monoxide dehydrogenase subunit G